MSSQSSFLECSGRKIQLVQGGTGPPVLYLHSAAGDAEWARHHEILSQHFHVYVPAHPGFATSGGLDTIHNIQDLAWHYVDFIESLKLDKVSIIGFSLGGWIAMELAVLRPALVSKLVLVASAGIRLPDVPVPDIFIDDRVRLRQMLFYEPDGELARNYVPESVMDERVLLWIRAREASARVAWNPYFHNPKLPQHLHRIQCPTLLLWGDSDRVFPIPIGEYLAKNISGARLVVLKQCGHMLPMERSEEFADQCLGFLRT